MKNFCNLCSIEFQRSIRETFSRPAAFALGILFLFGLYFGLQRFPWLAFVGDKSKGQEGVWVYFAWILCLSGTLEICNGLCADIASGVISKVAQSPSGIRAVLAARFVVCWTMASITVAVIFVGLCLWDGPPVVPGIRMIITFTSLMIQTYSVMLVLAGATLTQKTLGSAYAIGLTIIAPLTFTPFEAALGYSAVLLPISGPVVLLKHLQMFHSGAEISLLMAFIYLVMAKYIFDALVQRLRNNGALLFV